MDTVYYRERAATERRLAEAATQEEARAAHRELAERYDRLIGGDGTTN